MDIRDLHLYIKSRYIPQYNYHLVQMLDGSWQLGKGGVENAIFKPLIKTKTRKEAIKWLTINGDYAKRCEKAHQRAIKEAIALLEANGYKVMKGE